MMTLIKRLWHGDVPLYKSFWLYGVLVGLMLVIVHAVVDAHYLEVYKSFGLVPDFLLMAFRYGYFLFIYVAIWRSASKYQGQKHWRDMTRGAIFLGVVFLSVDGYRIFKDFTISTEDRLKEAIAEVSGQLPVMIDRGVTFYQVSSEDNTLTYHYEYATGAHGPDPKSFYETTRARLLEQACHVRGVKQFFRNNITVRYQYIKSDRSPLTEIVINRRDCGL